MAKKARVIAVLHMDGNTYQPNQVIEFDDKAAKELQLQGAIDTDPDAVAYCIKELSVQVIRHAPTEDEAARIAAEQPAA